MDPESIPEIPDVNREHAMDGKQRRCRARYNKAHGQIGAWECLA